MIFFFSVIWQLSWCVLLVVDVLIGFCSFLVCFFSLCVCVCVCVYIRVCVCVCAFFSLCVSSTFLIILFSLVNKKQKQN